MTAALLDRLTHRCHIFEMNGESFRFRESVKAKKETQRPAAKKETNGTAVKKETTRAWVPKNET